jgi:ribosomal-protein-alanine N-acetyltransferase
MSASVSMTLLRPGAMADLSAVDRVMREAFDPRFGEAWTPSQVAGVLAMPGVWLTIAEADGAATGFAVTRAILDEAELLLLAVRPSARRRGVGRQLLRSALAEARQRGVRRMHLEVRAGNDAVALYRAAGFEKIGERRGYYRGRNGKLFDAQTFQVAIG